MATINKLIVKLDKLSKIDVSKPLMKAGLIVETSAKEKVPVDTGQLRGSIKTEVHGASALIGTNVDYAPYVEFGTGLYAESGNGRKDVPWRYQDPEGNWHTTSGQSPQPYLRPALEENEKRILEVFQKEIDKELKK